MRSEPKKRKSKHGVCDICGRAVVMSTDMDVTNRESRVRCLDHADVVVWDYEILQKPGRQEP